MAYLPADLLAILRCPVTGLPLRQEGNELVTVGPPVDGERRYTLDEGIPVLLPPQNVSA